MKLSSIVLLALLLIVACSEQPEALPRVNLNQLNSLEQDDLKKELLSEMREKAEVWMTENALRAIKLRKLYSQPTFYREHSFKINLNSRGEIQLRGAPTSYEKLSEETFKYYTMNRSLGRDEIAVKLIDETSPNYKYPFYSQMTRGEIVDALKNERNIREKAKSAENYDLVEFHDLAIRDWEEKLRVIDILQTKELKEIQHIPIEIINEYDSLRFSRAADSVLVGIYKIRNAVALEYFGESYLSIYLRHKVLKNKQSADRLMAINYLYPLYISDQPYLTSIHVIETPLARSLYDPDVIVTPPTEQ